MGDAGAPGRSVSSGLRGAVSRRGRGRARQPARVHRLRGGDAGRRTRPYAQPAGEAAAVAALLPPRPIHPQHLGTPRPALVRQPDPVPDRDVQPRPAGRLPLRPGLHGEHGLGRVAAAGGHAGGVHAGARSPGRPPDPRGQRDDRGAGRAPPARRGPPHLRCPVAAPGGRAAGPPLRPLVRVEPLMLDQTRVAVVVPCYHAGRHIAEVVRSLPAFVDDIVVVDDGSPTPTAEALDVAADPRVVVIRHDVNRGLARAMGTGYTAALQRGAHVVIKMDGDGQMDPAPLPRLIAPIADGTADLCKGNRFLHRRLMVQMPMLRRAGNLALSFLAKAATGYWQIFDPTNGYVAVRRELLEAIDFDRLGPGYFFEISLLREACLAEAAAVDVPI